MSFAPSSRSTYDHPELRESVATWLIDTPPSARILRAMNNTVLLSRITVSPDVCHGKPCVRGLRYPVEFLLELLSSGMTHQEILSDYEDLEEDDLLAAMAWAARMVRVKRIESVPA